MKIVLASPRGFCAGVERAIDGVEQALARFGPPIYVRHEIVHNDRVVESFEARGVVFVDDPAEVPAGSVLIFSAHGVSPAVRAAAARARLRVVDATCPLVTKVHGEARRFADRGHEILLIGHAGHVEVEGTLGEAPRQIRLVETADDARAIDVADPTRLAVLTQTTLSVDDTREIVEVLRARFPEITEPRRADICYATQNRQDGVRRLAEQTDLVLVVGSSTSSNGMRLVETARRACVRAERVDTADEIDPQWLRGVERVGVTSGAAVPEVLVEAVVERLRALAGRPSEVISLPVVEERIVFKRPQALEVLAR